MTIDYQVEILKYLCKLKESKEFIKIIDSSIFDLSEHKVVFDMLKKYVEVYSVVPSKISLLEYFDKESKRIQISPENYKYIEDNVKNLYSDFTCEPKQLRETIVEFAQKQKGKEFIKKYADKLNDKNVFEAMRKDVMSIVALSESSQVTQTISIIADGATAGGSVYKEVLPTQYRYMNSIQKVKGFKAPEIIVIMAGPKSGKTTLMVNLAVGYLRDGYKVVYFDTENGIQRIKTLIHQCILGCTYDELQTDECREKLAVMLKKYAAMGGEIKLEELPPRRASTDDVELRLEKLKDQGFEPQVCFCDYFDNMVPSGKDSSERRLNLQAVYFDWKYVAVKYDFPVFTPSQVNRGSVNKPEFTIKDIGEDFGKVANCDSVWAYCRTPEEKEDGKARLMILANRDGKDYGTIYLDVDVKRVLIEENGMNERALSKLQKR